MIKTRKMVLCALFTALVCIATMVHIPIVGSGGYANLGDAMVLYCAYILGPVWGAFAAGLGSALTDFILGYTIYIPATLVIKALVAFVGAKLVRCFGEKYAVVGLLSEFIMVFGYLLYDALVLGFGVGGIAGIWANIGQALVGVVFSSVLMGIKPLKNIQ